MGVVKAKVNGEAPSCQNGEEGRERARKSCSERYSGIFMTRPPTRHILHMVINPIV